MPFYSTLLLSLPSIYPPITVSAISSCHGHVQSCPGMSKSSQAMSEPSPKAKQLFRLRFAPWSVQNNSHRVFYSLTSISYITSRPKATQHTHTLTHTCVYCWDNNPPKNERETHSKRFADSSKVLQETSLTLVATSSRLNSSVVHFYNPPEVINGPQQ